MVSKARRHLLAVEGDSRARHLLILSIAVEIREDVTLTTSEYLT